MRIKFIHSIFFLLVACHFISLQSYAYHSNFTFHKDEMDALWEQIDPQFWPRLKQLNEYLKSYDRKSEDARKLIFSRMLESARDLHSLRAIEATLQIPNFSEQSWPITLYELAEFLKIFSALQNSKCHSEEFIQFLSEYYHFIYPLRDFNLERLSQACSARYENSLTKIELSKRIRHLYQLFPLSDPFGQYAEGAYDQYILSLFIKDLTDPNFFKIYELSHPGNVFRMAFDLSDSYPIAGFVRIRETHMWEGQQEPFRYIKHFVQLAQNYSVDQKAELDIMLTVIRSALRKADSGLLMDYLPERRLKLKAFSTELDKNLDKIFRDASFKEIMLTKLFLWKLNHF